MDSWVPHSLRYPPLQPICQSAAAAALVFCPSHSQLFKCLVSQRSNLWQKLKSAQCRQRALPPSPTPPPRCEAPLHPDPFRLISSHSRRRSIVALLLWRACALQGELHEAVHRSAAAGHQLLVPPPPLGLVVLLRPLQALSHRRQQVHRPQGEPA